MKKLISVVLIISLILCLFTSCKKDSTDITDEKTSGELSDILEKYKTNGLSLWWEAVAVYNAGENPAEYKGFKELYLSLEGKTNLDMAKYVIVANIAIIKGANPKDFAKYEEYKSNLKNLLENVTGDYPLNDYIFGYYALRSSVVYFDSKSIISYFYEAQKSDGGFALSSSTESSDVDITAFAIPALKLAHDNLLANYDIEHYPPAIAVRFLESQINENGTFSSYGIENSNSTACALSALIMYYKDDANETVKKAADGLKLFTAKKGVGYSYLMDGDVNALATAQAAIALGDLENKTSVWEKLYNETQKININ